MVALTTDKQWRINAFAFAGAGYLFKMINSDGYSEEIKRHNLAMEQLTKAQQKWNEKEIEEERKVRELRQEKSDANEDLATLISPLKITRKSWRLYTTERNSRANHTYGTFTRCQKK